MEGYGYSDAWKAIIRPPRDQYTEEELGEKYFSIGKNNFQRTDFDIKNEKKQSLKCSFFEPIESERPAKELPCVIFLHGNSSSRLEGFPYAKALLPAGITLFCFDFSGSGLSDGDYISLGWWEREDVKVIVEFLRKSGRVSTIGLWGRSMGAVTALLHADRDPSIAGLVLDSPFSSMTKLAEELYKKYASGVPGFLYSMAQWFIKKSVRSRAQFEIDDLNPIDHVDKAFIPALFIVAKEDDFIKPTHGKELYAKYAGDKNLITVEGDHNSPRPHHAITSIFIFFHNTLQVEKLLPVIKEASAPAYKPAKSIHSNHPPILSSEFQYEPHDIEDDEDEEEEMLKKALAMSLETAKKETEERKKQKGQLSS